MTMLITKFHRLIQSKLLWGAFLVVVIFSFVIWGTAMPTKQERNAGAPGLLDGKPVPQEQFQRAYFSTYLTVVMALGRQISTTPEIDAQLREAAWQRIVALRAANEMGITASDDEVISAIQHHEGFSYEGQFHPQIYKAFVQNFLAQQGYGERMFEEHVREEIILQKTRNILGHASLVTPLEVQRAFRTVTDRFIAEYVVLEPALVESSVKVTEDDARAYFEKNPKLFTIPEQVRVDYVRLAATPFIPNVTVTDDDVQGYYDEHLLDYVDTNATTTADTETNLLDTLTRYRPIEDVKQDITNLLLEQKAMEAAEDAAMNFVVALTPDRDGAAPDFDVAASNASLVVNSLAPFSTTDELPSLQNEAAFKHAAFELGEGPETYFSNPVRGSNEVYVIALRQRLDSRAPEFSEVKETVTTIARKQALHDALLAKAEQVRDEAEKALAEKISFSETLAFYKLKPVKTEEFSATTGLADTNAPDREILTSVLTLNQGEISKPTPIETGILLTYLAERKSSDTVSLDSIRPQLIQTIRNQSARLNFEAWENYLLKKANFVNQRPAPNQDLDDEDYDGANEVEDAG